MAVKRADSEVSTGDFRIWFNADPATSAFAWNASFSKPAACYSQFGVGGRYRACWVGAGRLVEPCH